MLTLALDAQNASFGKVLRGVASTALNIYTTNAVPQYSNILPLSRQGNTVSQSAFFTIAPPEVDFGGLSNLGAHTMNIFMFGMDGQPRYSRRSCYIH